MTELGTKYKDDWRFFDEAKLKGGLEGKVLFVTGGNSGIGEEIVREASRLGAEVHFTYYPTDADTTAEEIAKQTGATAHYFELGNGTEDKQFEKIMENIAYKPLDYFIANAGIELSGGLLKHTPEEVAKMVNVKLTGNMNLVNKLILGEYTQEKRPQVIRRYMSKNGQISIIGSIAANGNHDQGAYSAVNAGLRGYVGSLKYDGDANEQGLGIAVFEPPFVRTPMSNRILKFLERKVIPQELRQQFADSAYVLQPEQAANSILGLTVDPKIVGGPHLLTPDKVSIDEFRETYLPKPKEGK